MAKIKIEVCETQEQARQRYIILEQKGWNPAQPEALEKAFWVNHCPGGATDTADDEDNEVWLVIARR